MWQKERKREQREKERERETERTRKKERRDREEREKEREKESERDREEGREVRSEGRLIVKVGKEYSYIAKSDVRGDFDRRDVKSCWKSSILLHSIFSYFSQNNQKISTVPSL